MKRGLEFKRCENCGNTSRLHSNFCGACQTIMDRMETLARLKDDVAHAKSVDDLKETIDFILEYMSETR